MLSTPYSFSSGRTTDARKERQTHDDSVGWTVDFERRWIYSDRHRLSQIEIVIVLRVAGGRIRGKLTLVDRQFRLTVFSRRLRVNAGLGPRSRKLDSKKTIVDGSCLHIYWFAHAPEQRHHQHQIIRIKRLLILSAGAGISFLPPSVHFILLLVVLSLVLVFSSIS